MEGKGLILPIGTESAMALKNKDTARLDAKIAIKEAMLKGKADELVEIRSEAYRRAMEAPIPNIGFGDTRLLLRACPVMQVGTAGIIHQDFSNFTEKELAEMGKMSVDLDKVQEILIIGDMVAEDYPQYKPGVKVRIDVNNFTAGRATPGYDNEIFYDLPVKRINGYDYVVITCRDVEYYLKD